MNTPFGPEALQSILAALPDPGFILTESGRYAALYGGTDSRYYHDGSGLVGKRMHEVLQPAKADWFLQQIQAALAQGKMRVVEYELGNRDVLGLPDAGPVEPIWFEGRISPLDLRVEGEAAVLWGWPATSRHANGSRTSCARSRKLTNSPASPTAASSWPRSPRTTRLMCATASLPR